MLCKIASLTVKIPAAGGMTPRCDPYAIDGACETDIAIDCGLYRLDCLPDLSEDDAVYLQSGFQFYRQLLNYDGLMLHSSAVALGGRAYLFSGPCGMGKSTHARLWQAEFGNEAIVFNDDKPALRRVNGKWIAYGTPWCGKDGINVNMSAPVAGICFLKQSQHNRIRRLTAQEAMQKIVWQTIRKFKDSAKLDLMLSHVDKLVREVPVFELENLPEPAAAQLSYETMLQTALEFDS